MADFDINLVIKDGVAIGQIRQVRQELEATEKRASNTRSILQGLFAGFGTAFAVRQFFDLANTTTTLDNRLRLATTTTDQVGAAFDRLRAISNETRSSLEGNVELFQKATQAQKELGASSEELYTFVEAVGTSLAIQGGSAATARGALIQLSQAIGSTIVRAEEFNSILDGALPLAQAAARGIDEAGGSVSRLRQMIVDGEITSKQFFQAILKEAPNLQAQFEKTNATIGQSFIVLRNEALAAFRTFEESTGIIAGIADVILVLAQNVDIAVQAVALLVAGFIAFKAAAAVTFIFGMVAAVYEFVTVLGLAYTASATLSTGIYYLRTASLALMATPLGVWLGLATIAIGGLVIAMNQATPATYDQAEATAELNRVLQEFRDTGAQSAANAALEIARTSNLAAVALERQTAAALAANAAAPQTQFSYTVDENGQGVMVETTQILLDLQEQLSQEVDRTAAAEKRVVQEIINAAEKRYEDFQILKQFGPEHQRQMEFYGEMRRVSDEQLAVAQEMLTNLQNENDLQRTIAMYGADSAQATALRNQQEIAALETALQSLEVADSLKQEIIAATIEKQKLANVDVATAIGLGYQMAVNLTQQLYAAASAAASIRIPSASGLLSGIASAAGGLTDTVNKGLAYLRTAKIAADAIKPNVGSGGGSSGGGAAGESFDDLIGKMHEQIKAYEMLGEAGDIYNAQQKIATQLKRELTAAENEQVAAAYKQLEVSKEASQIYDQLNKGARDYGVSLAALNQLAAKGAIDQNAYALALSKVKLVQDLQKVDQAIGGNIAYRAELQDVADMVAERTNILRQAREVDLINEQEYQARIRAVQRTAHLEAVNAEADRWDFAIQSASSSLGTILDYLEEYGDKQSGTYKAIFIAQKAFAIAEATVNTARAVTNALAAPFPPPIPQTLAAAAAVAGGAQIAAILASTIQGLAMGGRVRGPGGPTDDKAGLYALSNGEFVVNAQGAAGNYELLEAINRGQNIRGMLAAGGMVSNSTSAPMVRNAKTDVDNAKSSASKPNTTKQPAPVLNHTTIVVSSKDEALAVMGSSEGVDKTFEIVETNRNKFRSILGVGN